MSEEKLLTIREVSHFLGVSEKEVIELSEKGVIPAYRIGGVYLRFKQHQIEDYKKKVKPLHKTNPGHKFSTQDQLNDFLYFNDFYILSGLIIVIILFIIFRGY